MNGTTNERAIQRAHEEHLSIVSHTGDTYAVRNPKYGEGHYTVRLLSDGRLTCNCKAAEYGRTCKHTAFVAEERTLTDERTLRISDAGWKQSYAQMVLASY